MKKRLRYFIDNALTDGPIYCGDTIDEAVKAMSHAVKVELQALVFDGDNATVVLMVKAMTDKQVRELPDA